MAFLNKVGKKLRNSVAQHHDHTKGIQRKENGAKPCSEDQEKM
jgi:hypothetical protein